MVPFGPHLEGLLLKQRTACTKSCFSFIVKDLHSRRMRGSRQDFGSLNPRDPRTVGARDPARKTTIAANITVQTERKLCDGRHFLNLLSVVSCYSVIPWSHNRQRTRLNFIRESYASSGGEIELCDDRGPMPTHLRFSKSRPSSSLPSASLPLLGVSSIMDEYL